MGRHQKVSRDTCTNTDDGRSTEPPRAEPLKVQYNHPRRSVTTPTKLERTPQANKKNTQQEWIQCDGQVDREPFVVVDRLTRH